MNKKAIGLLVIGGGLFLFSRRADEADEEDDMQDGETFTSFFDRFSLRDFVLRAAGDLGISPERLYGVIAAESGGKPFSNLGRVVIRFEPHVFASLTGASVLLPGMSAPTAAEGRKRRGGRNGQADEWDAMDRATSINPEAAAKSASYGVGQLLGKYGYKLTGYPSAVAFREAMETDPLAQFQAFVRFIRNVPEAHNALRSGDYAGFVAVYNGAKRGTEKNAGYVERMLAAQRAFASGQVT